MEFSSFLFLTYTNSFLFCAIVEIVVVVVVYFKGDQADPRMRVASKSRGIEITSISRPIRPSDFREFDLILAMDRENRG